MHSLLRTPSTWSARSAIVLVLSLSIASCASSPTAPGGGYDSLYPRPATDRPLVAYFYASTSGSASSPVGIHLLNTSTHADALVFPGSVNGYDWIPGTDTLIVTTHNQIIALATSSLARKTIANAAAINCRVSSDGTKVAFDAEGASGPVVYVFNRLSGVIANVTPDSMLYQFPAWVGPTDQLLVVGTSPTGSGLYFLTPGGQPRRRLTASNVGTGYPFTSAACFPLPR